MVGIKVERVGIRVRIRLRFKGKVQELGIG
jgi:hypothetical protein